MVTTTLDIDEQYWREFAVKFARKRGVQNADTLYDIEQNAMAKLYSLDFARFKTQKDFTLFAGRSIANMIRDWLTRERPRTHFQLFEFTELLNTTNKIEDYIVDYVSTLIPRRVTFARGEEALVDEWDYHYIEEHSWHIKNCGRKSYVRAWTPDKKKAKSKKGKSKDNKQNKGTHIYLHQQIARSLVKIPEGATVNFINGDTLDCRRCNLAIGHTPLEYLL